MKWEPVAFDGERDMNLAFCSKVALLVLTGVQRAGPYFRFQNPA